MMSRRILTSMLVMATMLTASQKVDAQGFANAQVNQFRNSVGAAAFSSDRIRSQVLRRSYGQIGVAGVNARNFGLTSNPGGNRQKPFQSLNRGPAVSPYLSLTGSLNSVSDFYNVVRPQQEFQRARRQQEVENQRAQRAILANQHRLNQMAAAPPYNIKGDQDTAPTGHSSTYMYFDNFQSTGGFFTPIVGLEKRR